MARFPGNRTLEILIKIHNCVGSTNMRGRFLMKVCLFPIYNCPVILEYFLGLVYLILVNLRNFNPRKIPFFVSFLCETISPLLTTGRDWYQKMWNFMAHLMVHITWLRVAAQKNAEQKTSKKGNKFTKIPENSKKFTIFSHIFMCSFIIISRKNNI